MSCIVGKCRALYFYYSSMCITGTVLQTLILGRTLSSLTTVDQVYNRELKRWLTAIEKLSIMGFCTTPEVSQVYKQDPWSIVCSMFYVSQGLQNALKQAYAKQNHLLKGKVR